MTEVILVSFVNLTTGERGYKMQVVRNNAPLNVVDLDEKAWMELAAGAGIQKAAEAGDYEEEDSQAIDFPVPAQRVEVAPKAGKKGNKRARTIGSLLEERRGKSEVREEEEREPEEAESASPFEPVEQ